MDLSRYAAATLHQDMGSVALGRVIARETIETLPLVAMIMNPRIVQFGLKLEF